MEKNNSAILLELVNLCDDYLNTRIGASDFSDAFVNYHLDTEHRLHWYSADIAFCVQGIFSAAEAYSPLWPHPDMTFGITEEQMKKEVEYHFTKLKELVKKTGGS